MRAPGLRFISVPVQEPIVHWQLVLPLAEAAPSAHALGPLSYFAVFLPRHLIIPTSRPHPPVHRDADQRREHRWHPGQQRDRPLLVRAVAQCRSPRHRWDGLSTPQCVECVCAIPACPKQSCKCCSVLCRARHLLAITHSPGRACSLLRRAYHLSRTGFFAIQGVASLLASRAANGSDAPSPVLRTA